MLFLTGNMFNRVCVCEGHRKPMVSVLMVTMLILNLYACTFANTKGL